MTKMPASPQEELPILSTDEGSEDGSNGADLVPVCEVEVDDDEVVLMATINPATTTGNTNPELHFVSYRYSLPLRSMYNGESTIADTKANTIATAL